MTRLTTIELDKEYLKFSAAHFTIFSATERERLHGHNFSVTARLVAPVDDNGMCFRYALFKTHLRKLCQTLDEYTLLAAHSPHLRITEHGTQYRVLFNNEELFYLQADTLLLPIRNTTVEELSHYLLEHLLQDDTIVADNHLQRIDIGVASGPGQCGYSHWQCPAP
jgi:6-pyruvoyltetrahydropterin/6-carboxytetrahydropterin synthase